MILLLCVHNCIHEVEVGSIVDPLSPRSDLNQKNNFRDWIYLKKPGTRRWVRKELQIMMDELTDWWTARLQICFTMHQKIPILETLFSSQICLTIFGKKTQSPMEKGRIGFLIIFQQPGRNYVPTIWKRYLFCYINSNCVFSKTIWKNECIPMEKVQIEFSIAFHQPGWNEQNGNVQIFFYINSNCLFSNVAIWARQGVSGPHIFSFLNLKQKLKKKKSFIIS